MTPTIAYLAGGKLYVKSEGREAQLIESAFAQEMIEDALRRRQKDEWKTRSQTGRIMAGGGLFGGSIVEGETRRIHISGVTHGRRPGELLYALDTDQTGGLFTYDLTEKREQRLYHDHRFQATHLARHPTLPLLAFSKRQDDGTAAIAVINLDTNELNTATEGDSLDEAPAWVPGDGKRLVFQSAGVARNQQGALAGIGPYAVQELELDADEMETLAEDTKRDYLLPRMTGDGSLYYLRRPYQGLPRASAWGLLRDIVMLPVALVMALFGFLNFFAMMFSGKPLMTSGGPKREGAEPRHLLLWGKMIDAERAERKARKGEPASLVPDDWELVRRNGNAETVLCGGVVSWDLCEDGSVVYTNGSAVYHRQADGKRTLLAEGKLVEHVAALG